MRRQTFLCDTRVKDMTGKLEHILYNHYAFEGGSVFDEFEHTSSECGGHRHPFHLLKKGNRLTWKPYRFK